MTIKGAFLHKMSVWILEDIREPARRIRGSCGRGNSSNLRGLLIMGFSDFRAFEFLGLSSIPGMSNSGRDFRILGSDLPVPKEAAVWIKSLTDRAGRPKGTSSSLPLSQKRPLGSAR